MQKNIFMFWRNCQFGDEQEEHQGAIVAITIIAITDRGSVTLDCDKSDGGQKREWRPSRFQADSQLSASKGQVETRWSPKLLNHVIRSEGSLFQSTATSVKATSSQGGKSTTSAFRRKKESKAESSSQPSEAAPAKPARSNPALASSWNRPRAKDLGMPGRVGWSGKKVEAHNKFGRLRQKWENSWKKNFIWNTRHAWLVDIRLEWSKGYSS